jgi:hypothetical protein
MDTMTPRERFRAVMRFEPFDRLPLLEWAGWWDKTLDRWFGEGLDPSFAAMPPGYEQAFAIREHLGLDPYRQDWIDVRKPSCPGPASHGAPVIGSLEEYEALLPHLYPRPAVDRERWEQWARERDERGTVLWFSLDGFFWFPRKLLGIEPHLYAFYDEPELMHRINADLAAWHTQVLDELFAICVPDFMTFGEDMSYNNGPMLSRDLFDEFLRPYYDLVIPPLREADVLPVVDSDGDITTAAAWFREAGLDGILPLERQAGVDMNVLRARYPDMRFIGHFDKMCMSRGETAMRAEFERLLPAAAKGGFAVSCDHQTPPGVSFQQYQTYLRLFREFAEKAGRRSQTEALARTAERTTP